MNCKKCDVPMVEGVALKENYTMGAPDFPGNDESSRGQTFSPAGNSNMVTVAKCPECGYSVTV